MEIVNLKQRPEIIPTLAGWHHAQWGELNPQKTIESRIKEFELHLADRPIPVTFVAAEGDAPLGSASLLEHDLPTRPDLTPWLASVFVAPEHRRRGVGAALVRRIVAEADRLQIDPLYLFTLDREQFYARLGWSVVEQTEYNGHAITVMSIHPQAVFD